MNKKYGLLMFPLVFFCSMSRFSYAELPTTLLNTQETATYTFEAYGLKHLSVLARDEKANREVSVPILGLIGFILFADAIIPPDLQQKTVLGYGGILLMGAGASNSYSKGQLEGINDNLSLVSAFSTREAELFAVQYLKRLSEQERISRDFFSIDNVLASLYTFYLSQEYPEKDRGYMYAMSLVFLWNAFNTCYFQKMPGEKAYEEYFKEVEKDKSYQSIMKTRLSGII